MAAPASSTKNTRHVNFNVHVAPCTYVCSWDKHYLLMGSPTASAGDLRDLETAHT